MADTPQYVIKVTFEVFNQTLEEAGGKAGLEQTFVMRNLNQAELLSVDGDLLKFYTELMASLKAKAETEGLYLDLD